MGIGGALFLQTSNRSAVALPKNIVGQFLKVAFHHKSSRGELKNYLQRNRLRFAPCSLLHAFSPITDYLAFTDYFCPSLPVRFYTTPVFQTSVQVHCGRVTPGSASSTGGYA